MAGSKVLQSRERLVALAISSLLYLGTIRAQTVVPLNDPGISFTGNAHYNASLCGGAIYLPNIGDSISWNFTGTDWRITAILGGEHSDLRKTTTLPEGSLSFAYYQGLNRPFPDCSQNDEEERWSGPRRQQLPLGPHTVVIQNEGNATDRGAGVLIGDLRYWPDPIQNLPTYTPKSQSSKSKKNHTGAIIGGVVGGVVFLAAVIVGGLFLWKPSFRQRFTRKRSGSAPRPLLAGSSLSKAGVSRSSMRISREEQRTDAGQLRMAEQAPLLASDLANINNPNSRLSSEGPPNRS
ncbi:hypothetical protein M407DRAFT_23541 [Tulasnella calospora MUT 4182]|uniref:Uncharacterized protein n=1 Tax=Tulasnella calospora MUT 4182 TaxID=1051891 RepID=A0A0C3QJG0_9AGAM|nr:hypothetical protein M407DRAFT_23541 [Tulasnella calospora MUT 4182]